MNHSLQHRTRWIVVAATLLAPAVGCTLPNRSCDPGDASTTGFVNRVYTAPDGSRSKYVVFVPHDYDGRMPLPVILFLHGLGQSGNDGLAQVTYGLAAAIRKNETSFPFITVFPQSQERTWDANSDDGRRAVAILDEVAKDYKVDTDRVFLTGYSMGGAGTWSLAAAHPTRWAAIVPICGGGDLRTVDAIKDIPCWSFVGDTDAPSTVYGVRATVQAMKEAGGHPIHNEFPGVGHRCWDLAYAQDGLFNWLLKQRPRRDRLPAL